MLSRRLRHRILAAAALVGALALVFTMALPRIADHLVRARITSRAARAGYQLEYDRLAFSMPNQVRFESLAVTDREGSPLLSIGQLAMVVDRRALFLGGMPIVSADARHVRLSGHAAVYHVEGTIARLHWHEKRFLTAAELSLRVTDGLRALVEAGRISVELADPLQFGTEGVSGSFGLSSDMRIALLEVEDAAVELTRLSAGPEQSAREIGLEAPARHGSAGARYLRRAVRLMPHALSLGNVRISVSDGATASRAARWAEAEIDRFELSRASVESGTELRGDLRLGVVRVALPSVADEVIDFAPLRYRFTTLVDGNAPLPPARLIRPLPGTRGDSAAGVPASAGGATAAGTVYRAGAAAALRGSVLTTEGSLRIGSVEMEFRPALRGFRGILGSLMDDVPTTAATTLPPADDGRSGSSLRDQLPARIELLIDLPLTPLSDLHAAVPSALLGDLRTVRLDGRFGWRFDLEAPTDELGRMQWRVESQLEEFAVAHLAPSVDVTRLTGTFIHRIVDPATGFDRTVRVPATSRPPVSWLREQSDLTDEQIDRLWNGRIHRGAVSGAPHRFDGGHAVPDPTYRFVPLTDISPWVVRAILTGEDGDFFYHGGVNWNAVRRAVERNVNEGAFVVGASTIPMQLAKNLFLSNDRLMARKLQEVALVFLMEQYAGVSKERILELYLNLIEFGPGVFGIYDAARYYFNAHPQDLTAVEAVWLASIVPNPRRYHFYFERGAVTEGWFARMQQYLEVMLLRGRMTEEEYAEAVQERPQFARR